MAEPHRKQILKEMVADLESLPEARLEEVREFVEFLKRKTSQEGRGAPEALLRSFGSWQGPAGELDRLVAEIYDARHQEE